MDQDRRHPERVCDEAGMLAAGTAETVERIARHVIAALHRNFLDRVRHILDGDGDEAVRHRLGALAAADLGCHRRKGRAHGLGIERLVPARAENGREEIRLQLADHDVGVGHRERPAVAVSLRPGLAPALSGPQRKRWPS